MTSRTKVVLWRRFLFDVREKKGAAEDGAGGKEREGVWQEGDAAKTLGEGL